MILPRVRQIKYVSLLGMRAGKKYKINEPLLFFKRYLTLACGSLPFVPFSKMRVQIWPPPNNTALVEERARERESANLSFVYVQRLQIAAVTSMNIFYLSRPMQLIASIPARPFIVLLARHEASHNNLKWQNRNSLSSQLFHFKFTEKKKNLLQ